MPLVVIPDLTLQSKPRVQDVRDAEEAIMDAVGGSLAGVRIPGALDAANLSATPGFVASQIREARSRCCLTTAKTDALGTANPYTTVPHQVSPRALVVVPFDFESDVVTFWHNDPVALTGTIGVYLDGSAFTEFLFPGAGVAQGAFAEFQFRYLHRAGSTIDFRWNDGTTWLKHLDNSAPAAYGRLTAHLWGVTRHRA